jgi:hypothetical protein
MPIECCGRAAVPVNRFEAVIVRPAEESLKEALQKLELHPSLLERP